MKCTWFFALSLVLAGAASAQSRVIVDPGAPVPAGINDYKVIDLGPLVPVGINIEGEVAGNVNGAAAIWTAVEGIRQLDLLPSGTLSRAVSINDAGTIAGTAETAGVMNFGAFGLQDCSDLTQPFSWSRATGFQTAQSIPSAWPPLAFDYPCYQQDYATGINIRGQIVGSNMDIATYKYGFVWAGANGLDLLTGDYQSGANAINDYGIVAGQIGNNILGVASHAAIWTNGVQTDLGTLAGDSSVWTACSGAAAVNDLNQVVGWSGTTASSETPCYDITDSQAPVRAFLWTSDGGMRDLGALPGDTASVALKINIFGVAIGMSGNSAIENQQEEYALTVTGRPFMWTAVTGMRDLNSLLRPDSGWVLNSAADINAWGQIVGTGTLNGEVHGFLLTPQVLFGYQVPPVRPQ
jgi:probable HAF family extracellular repeat protein